MKAHLSLREKLWIVSIFGDIPASAAARLYRKATMPTMTHGTTPVTIMSNGDGTYTFTPLYFFMAGLWQVAITATSGAQKDTTSFYFCVAG